MRADDLLSSDQRCRARVFESDAGVRRWRAVMLQPSPPLDQAVAWLWYVEGRCTVSARLPPIIGVEIVFNLGDPYRLAGARGPAPSRFATAWIEGLRDTWLDSEATGATALLGARLLPAGAYLLFGPALKDLGNQILQAETVMGSDLLAVRDQLGATPELATRFDLLEAYLRARLAAGRHIDPRVGWAATRLARGRNGKGVRDLSRGLSLSHQRFGEIFHRQVGLTPKRYARIARFDGVVAALVGSSEVDWAQIALRHGFFDQAHLVREFKLMAGCTPTEFLCQRDALGQSVAILE